MDQQTACRKAQDLLNQMTIEEKIAQMTQIPYTIPACDTDADYSISHKSGQQPPAAN